MLNFIFIICLLFLIIFGGFHILGALMTGAVFAFAGSAWAILIASICFISMGLLAVFLFAGFWIIILASIIACWFLISLILFPILLPLLLPLLLVFIVIFLIRKKQNLHQPQNNIK